MSTDPDRFGLSLVNSRDVRLRTVPMSRRATLSGNFYALKILERFHFSCCSRQSGVSEPGVVEAMVWERSVLAYCRNRSLNRGTSQRNCARYVFMASEVASKSSGAITNRNGFGADLGNNQHILPAPSSLHAAEMLPCSPWDPSSRSGGGLRKHANLTPDTYWL